MKMSSRFAILGLLLIAMLAVAPVVSAHPLGNFTINHFARLNVTQEGVTINYVLDMAEIPTFQEISLLDKNQNGKADPDELAGYPDKQCLSIVNQLSFQRNGAELGMTLAKSGISFPAGAGGLSTLRLTCTFQSPSTRFNLNDRLDFQDNSYSDRIGWREIVVSGEGIGLIGQFSTQSISKELTAYPQDMLSSPLAVRQVSFQVGDPSVAQPVPTGKIPGLATSNYTVGGQSDRFTELITLQNLTPAGILLALLIAFVWGGLHSLTPGHGKTIVGAYLVGSRGTAMHAVYLGLMTTVTHTAGVFLLGFITYFASRYILPEQLFPWISVLSGVLVIVIGISLCVGRLRQTEIWKELINRLKKGNPAGGYEIKAPHPVSSMQISAIAAMPSSQKTGNPAALNQMQHHTGEVHTHDGVTFHTHSPDGHTHTHSHDGATFHTHSADDHAHAHDAADPEGAGMHSHGPGGAMHSHVPPIDPGTKVTWRSLLALGISGGLLPCPSALVVLLGAIALNKIGFGIVLVLVFSLGLAGVLTGIGLALVYARKFFDRLPIHSRLIDLIPAGSALFITILGVGITLQAITQMGWISL